MSAVTKDGRSGVFTSAKINRFGLRGFELDGRKVCDLMAAIAEGLIGAEAAGAPEVGFAGFKVNGIRALLGNRRSGHGKTSLKGHRAIIAKAGRVARGEEGSGCATGDL